MRPKTRGLIVLALLVCPPALETGAWAAGSACGTAASGTSSFGWTRPAYDDTLRTLVIFATFPDGDDLTHCDTTAFGWPDGTTVPAWADSVIEDTTSPVIEGSLTHFYSLMSGGKHIIKGTVFDSLVTVSRTIDELDSLYSGTDGGFGAYKAANHDVVTQALTTLGDDALGYDLNNDGYFDHIFVYYRQRVSTSGTVLTIFGGIANLLVSDTTFVFPGGSITVGGAAFGTGGGGSTCFWNNFLDPSGSSYRYIDRWQVLGIFAHEYHHHVWGSGHSEYGPYGVREGTVPVRGRRHGIMLAQERIAAGWITPIEIDSTVTNGDTTIVLRDAAVFGASGVAIVNTHRSNTVWQCFPDTVQHTTTPQKFILECRSSANSEYMRPHGSGFCAVPASPTGLLVTHTSPSGPRVGTNFEMADGLFSDNGSLDPARGQHEMEVYPGGTPEKTWGTSVFDLFQDGAGFANTLGPYTNPNTNLHGAIIHV